MATKLTYQQLLTCGCTCIAQKVLSGMKPYEVASTSKIPVPHKPILYRWWFPEDSKVLDVLREYNQTESVNLLDQVETRVIDNKRDGKIDNKIDNKIESKTYYALYFGKSSNGYRRYCQHTTGNIHLSTLRQTLYGLCVGQQYDIAKEQDVSNILKDCYFEWLNLDKEGELVECIESICIALGHYPLNLDGNPAISDQWRRYVTEKRKIAQ